MALLSELHELTTTSERDNSVPRVAHVVISLVHGGLEQCAIRWCRFRNELHPESTVIICLDAPGPLAEGLGRGVVHAIHANRHRFPWDRRAVEDLRHLLLSLKIDIVHSHNVAARQYAVLACTPPIRHVNTDHGTNPHGKGLVNRIRYRYTRKHTDVVVAVSEDAASQFRRSFSTRPNEMIVIENGVDCREKAFPSRTMLRQRFGVSDDAPLLGCVGRLSHEKGVDRLIHSLAIAHETGVDATNPWHLLIIGDGPQAASLRQLSESCNVDEYIHFAGAIPDAVDILHTVDLLVMPSRSEGLPLVLLEAMSRRVPVLVTDVGENRAVIDDGRCGYLLPEDEADWPQVICNTLRLVMQKFAANCTQAALLRVRTQYSLEQTLSTYERLYAGLIHRLRCAQ